VCGTISACLDVGAITGTASPACGGQVCVRAGQENETCGLYCGGATPCVSDFPICDPTLACVNTVCVKPKAAGQSCGSADPVPCATFLSCSADPADPQSTGTCQAHVAGGSCRADADCVGTEFCLQGMCTGHLQLGAPCGALAAPTGCVPWTACDASGVCVPAGRPGLPCAPFPGTPDFLTCAVGACLDGAVCSGYASTGESCNGAACLPGNGCDPATLTCVACPP
jgi:hypothetical protein